MRRSDRKQTVEKAQQLKSKLDQREEKKRHKALSDQNNSEVIGLSSESGNLRGNNSNQEKIEEEVEFTSEDEYYWYDSCGQDLIGTSLSSPPFPASPADASSWSVGVNRLTSDTDPNLLDSLRQVSSPVFDFNLQLPPTSIEHNTNSKYRRQLIQVTALIQVTVQ